MCQTTWRCRKERQKAELALSGHRLGDPDGDALRRRDHPVQYGGGGGNDSLAPLRWQAPGAEFEADQVFVSRHCRFGLVPPARTARLSVREAARQPSGALSAIQTVRFSADAAPPRRPPSWRPCSSTAG